jgi:hypothetical protein
VWFCRPNARPLADAEGNSTDLRIGLSATLNALFEGMSDAGDGSWGPQMSRGVLSTARFLGLTAMSLSAIGASSAVAYISMGGANYVSCSTGHFVRDAQDEPDRYGLHLVFARWAAGLGTPWDGCCTIIVWYPVPMDTPESQVSKTAGPFRLSRYSGRSFAVDCFGASLERSDGTRNELLIIRLPALMLVPVLGGYPFLVLLQGPWRRSRRRAKGLCVRCAYNLTGNVTGVCPECGTPTPTSAASCSKDR